MDSFDFLHEARDLELKENVSLLALYGQIHPRMLKILKWGDCHSLQTK